MPYRCLIVDDEELARELIETHLLQLPNFQLVASCENAIIAQQILQRETIDLLFLDIEMPILSGTDFLKNLSTPPKVIFTTAYRDYAVEGFELNAVDYLLKPIEFDRFFKAIERFTAVVSNKTEQRKGHIFVSKNKKNIKVKLHEIHYIESVKDYVRINFENQQLMIKIGITAFAQMLDDRFLRVHRSFLVNQDNITAFTKNDIEIQQVKIPIGEYYKQAVLEVLS